MVPAVLKQTASEVMQCSRKKDSRLRFWLTTKEDRYLMVPAILKQTASEVVQFS
jgi:hypothetical protein